MLNSIELNTPENILAFIILIITLVALVITCILACVYAEKTAKMREDHIKTLNEHDKAVIMTYKNINYRFFKTKADKKQC